MKKTISLMLVLVMIFSMAAISFASKPVKVADFDEAQYEYQYQHGNNGLPYGLSKREELPFGLLKMQLDEDITIEDIEMLIKDINEYIVGIDGEIGCEFTIIDAINVTIEEINFELLKKEPELNDLFNQLSRKFEILKRQVVECEEEINYVDELTDLKTDLEEALEDEDILPEDVVLINALILDIDELLLEDEITEAEYEAIAERALVYIEAEDEDEFYNELLLDFENLKLTEIVAGNYLTKVNDYKILLEAIVTEDLTEDELLEYNALMELVDLVILNEKMTLGEFNFIESQTVEFILNIDYYILELDTLMDDARDLILNNPIDLNDKDLIKSRFEFVKSFLKVLKLKGNAETISDYQETIEILEEAMEIYQLELDK